MRKEMMSSGKALHVIWSKVNFFGTRPRPWLVLIHLSEKRWVRVMIEKRAEKKYIVLLWMWICFYIFAPGEYSCWWPLLWLQTQVLYRWVEPKICVENITGAMELPATGQREPCPPCNPGYYNSNDSTCLPCPPGTHSDGTYGKPANTWHVLGWCCVDRSVGSFKSLFMEGKST